jgi:hypothetical protein
MAIVATITDQINVGSRLVVEGTFTFSGNYVAGGEVPSFPGVRTGKTTPVSVDVNALAGYIFSYDRATGKLIIFQDNATATAAALPALAAAAYPAGLTGTTTYFSATFRKP